MADTTPPCLQQQKPYIIIMSNEQQDNKNTTTSNISSSNKTVSGPPPHDDVNASATTAGFVNLSIGSFDNINAVNTDDLQQLVGGGSPYHMGCRSRSIIFIIIPHRLRFMPQSVGTCNALQGDIHVKLSKAPT